MFRKLNLLRFAVIVFLIVGIVGTLGVVYASQQLDGNIYHVAVYKKVNMRRLLPEKDENESCKGKVTPLTLQYNGSEAVPGR